ncbi:MAG TPA: histidine kinase dimerization/phosphoacceptor domain -containing protein [Acidimicrobiales bacterium]|nr:histidine kinase dimerization/phosphoacceptor domain -containing protein [Acidimicrobiales bacterium]
MTDPALATRAPGAKSWDAAAVVVAACTGLVIVIFAIFGLLVWQAYASAGPRAEREAQASADLLAEEAQWLVGGALTLITHLSTDALRNPAQITTADKPELDQLLKTLPADVELAYYDANGDVRFGTPFMLPQSIAAARFFTNLAGATEWTITAQPLAGRQTPGIILAKRIERPDGDGPAGAVVLAIDTAFLERHWTAQDLGQDSTISLIERSGAVVARYPALTGPLNVGTQPGFVSAAAADSGTYWSDSSPADGVARVVGFRHIPALNLIALASISRDTVYAGILNSTLIVLALLGPIALALLLGSIQIAREIRRREATMARLSEAVAQNEVLFREIHHRVKNNLQTISSLLRLQGRRLSSAEAKGAIGESVRRISSIALVHDILAREAGEDIPFIEVLRPLVRMVEESLTSPDREVRFSVHGDPGILPALVATPMAVVLNELLQNTMDHAFPSAPDRSDHDGQAGGAEGDGTDDDAERPVGQVRIEMENDGQQLVARVIDDGVGLSEGFSVETATGLGLSIVRALVTSDLNGTIDMFEPLDGGPGTEVELRIPLDAEHSG